MAYAGSKVPLVWKKGLYSLASYKVGMANKRGDRPYVTINLKVSEEEYSKLIEKKEKETWESFFLRVAGI